jgi:chromosome segregation ATPase
MARGITESDVHDAADELVAKGDRPTVERIRMHLGTGSPNTVTRWLETWWQGLGPRLHSHAAHLAIPGAPEAVLDLAGQWWSIALASARDVADHALAVDRAQLEADRADLERSSAALDARSRGIDVQLGLAQHAEQLALAQTGELQRLVSQLQAQLAETSLQRDTTLTQLDQAREAGIQLQRQLEQQLSGFQTEREQFTQHVRAVENRAHLEVDRGRQEIKELKAEISATNKERARREKELVTNAQRTSHEVSRAIQDASAQRARADALETQLSQLKDLPAAMQAVLVRARHKAKPGASSESRKKSSSSKRQINAR